MTSSGARHLRRGERRERELIAGPRVGAAEPVASGGAGDRRVRRELRGHLGSVQHARHRIARCDRRERPRRSHERQGHGRHLLIERQVDPVAVQRQLPVDPEPRDRAERLEVRALERHQRRLACHLGDREALERQRAVVAGIVRTAVAVARRRPLACPSSNASVTIAPAGTSSARLAIDEASSVHRDRPGRRDRCPCCRRHHRNRRTRRAPAS